MSYLTKLAQINLSVHHGRFDKAVPYIHTLNLAMALNALEPKNFFFEIFDGEHEFIPERAFCWFDKVLKMDNRMTALTN